MSDRMLRTLAEIQAAGAARVAAWEITDEQAERLAFLIAPAVSGPQAA